MSAYMPYLWTGVIVLSLIVEAVTSGLVAIWFVPAALVSVIVSLAKVDVWVQVLLFLILSAAFIVLFKFVFRKFVPKKQKKTNLDLIVGEKAVVIEEIDDLRGCGQVKVKGQIWSARAAEEDKIFDVGETVTVIAIEGVKLICK